MKEKIEHKSVSAEILGTERKADENGKSRLTIKFYAATFNNIDSYRDTIQAGAFKKGTVGTDWDRVAFCKQHDMRQPIGLITVLKEDAKGLYCEVELSASEEDIATKVEEGILREFSIGYQSKKSTRIEDAKDGEADRILEEIKLYEISLVTRAADENSAIVNAERKEEEFKDLIVSLESKSYEELKEIREKADAQMLVCLFGK